MFAAEVPPACSCSFYPRLLTLLGYDLNAGYNARAFGNTSHGDQLKFGRAPIKSLESFLTLERFPQDDLNTWGSLQNVEDGSRRAN